MTPAQLLTAFYNRLNTGTATVADQAVLAEALQPIQAAGWQQPGGYSALSNDPGSQPQWWTALLLIGQGGGGGPLVPGVLAVVPFTFATASPLDIVDLPAGYTIAQAWVEITVAFNGVGAALTLGSTFAPTEIFASGEVDPFTTDTYANSEAFGGPSSAADSIQLAITPGTATQGAGLVIILYQP